MTAELSVLKRVNEGLERLALPYMLTGSCAMAHYAVPRMTRDIDIVVSKEDLILSKLVWSADSRSQLQRRDVVQLLSSGPADLEYLRANALRLGVHQALEELLP